VRCCWPQISPPRLPLLSAPSVVRRSHINKNMARCPPLGVTQQQIKDNFHRYITASDYAVYISGVAVLLFTLTARAFWC